MALANAQMNLQTAYEENITTNYKESDIIFDRGTKLKILDARLKHDTGNERGIVLECIIEGVRQFGAKYITGGNPVW